MNKFIAPQNNLALKLAKVNLKYQNIYLLLIQLICTLNGEIKIGV